MYNYIHGFYFQYSHSVLEVDVIEEDEVHMDAGILHQVELGFDGIKMTLTQGKKISDRIILDGSIKGKARPGRMVRI